MRKQDPSCPACPSTCLHTCARARARVCVCVCVFSIARWQSAGHHDYNQRPPAEVAAFIDKMQTWVDGALASGSNVLVHCLAGAHRAGTTGILLLMKKGNLSAMQATVAAKSARDIIDPIFDFKDCLQVYEAARKTE